MWENVGFMKTIEKQKKYGELRVYPRADLKKMFEEEAKREGRIFSKQLDKILEERYQPKES